MLGAHLILTDKQTLAICACISPDAVHRMSNVSSEASIFYTDLELHCMKRFCHIRQKHFLQVIISVNPFYHR